MKLNRVVLLALLLAALSPAIPSAAFAEEPDDLKAGIDRLVTPLVEGQVVLGMAVGVIRGEEAREFAYGELPAGAGSVFEIGSISKVFTAYLLADLVRDGTVKLDQPVRELLPEGTTVPKFGDREITLMDLVTHRSGLPRMPSNFAPKDPRNPYADYDQKLLFEYLAIARLSTKPGEKKLYSNLGMGFLGQALALKSNLTYEQLLRNRILLPLSLPNTSITLTEDQHERLAPGHNADLGPEPNWDLNVLAGAGGIRSTVADMLRFLAVHLDPKDGVPDLRLGWHPAAMPGSSWHNGQTGGYHSMVAVVPGQKLAVVILADTASPRIDDLGGRILRLLAGERVDPPHVRRPVEVETEVLESCVGRYRYSESVVMEVTRDERGLLVQMPGQSRHRLYAESESRFFLRVVEATLVFQKDESGAVNQVVLQQGGQEHAAPRVR